MAGSGLTRMKPKAIMAALHWCQFSCLIFALMKGIMAGMIRLCTTWARKARDVPAAMETTFNLIQPSLNPINAH